MIGSMVEKRSSVLGYVRLRGYRRGLVLIWKVIDSYEGFKKESDALYVLIKVILIVMSKYI